MYYARHLLPALKKTLRRSPVVFLTGARQTGKTTLVSELAKESGSPVVSFDDLNFLSAATHDPKNFITSLPKPAILDEIQRVPELFLSIKQDVDLHRAPGRYLLTGSSSPLLLPKISDSLAGRMEILKLSPFSQGELIQKEESFLDALFLETLSPFQGTSLPKEILAEMFLCGGFPVMQKFEEEEDMEAWCNGYISTLLQKDVQELAKIEGLFRLPNLLKLLASRVGNLLNSAELSRTSGIAASTLHRYLHLLEALFLLDFLPPCSLNLGKREVKSPKTFLLDTALLCFLLGANRQRLISQSNMLANIFENFVISELKKQSGWCRQRIDFYHFRSQTGIEVDIIAENRAGKYVGIEVKSSSTVTFADFKGLLHIQKSSPKNFLRGIILYPGAETIPFGKDLTAIPLTALWEQ